MATKLVETENLYELLVNAKVSAKDRAQTLTYMCNEVGLDCTPSIQQVLEERDACAKLMAKMEKAAQGTCMSFKYLGQVGINALLCSGTKQMLAPQIDMPHDVEFLDTVYINDGGQIQLVEKANKFNRGDIATIEAVYPDGVSVRHEGGTQFALLSQHESLKDLGKGDQVLWDKHEFIVNQKIEEGERPNIFANINDYWLESKDIGSLHPDFNMMLRRLSAMAEHPKWVRKLKMRPMVSYLFSGPTGTGKSFHARLLASEMTRYCETKFNKRVSRLVMLDASQIWDKYFGETERKIAQFFDNLNRELEEQDKELKSIPIIVMLEEAESLLRSRTDSQGNSSHLFDRPLAMILQRMQSVTTSFNVPIAFLVTTNRPDLIDVAARRRFGVREMYFSVFTAEQATDVYQIKTAPILGRSTKRFVEEVVEELYSEDANAIVHLKLEDGRLVPIRVTEFITGAVIEESISSSVDLALDRSMKKNEFKTIQPTDVIISTVKQAKTLAKSLTVNNIENYLPQVCKRVEGKIADISVT